MTCARTCCPFRLSVIGTRATEVKIDAPNTCSGHGRIAAPQCGHAGVTKTQREIMTDKTLEALTDEEWDMIETIRENREDDGFRLLIERKHGVWAIELKTAKVPNLDRGTGVDFNQAWDNMTEIIR